jgi:ribosome-binding protein aMBF1 (putative translation factor)
MGVVTQHEPTNGRCSLCGRKSENVTTAELGDWIVQDGGILICSGCSSDAEKGAAEPQVSRRPERPERPEKMPTSTARPGR